MNKIPEYFQCFNCKRYFTEEKLVKVLRKPSLLQRIKGENSYNILCKECVNP